MSDNRTVVLGVAAGLFFGGAWLLGEINRYRNNHVRKEITREYRRTAN